MKKKNRGEGRGAARVVGGGEESGVPSGRCMLYMVAGGWQQISGI